MQLKNCTINTGYSQTFKQSIGIGQTDSVYQTEF